MRQRAPRARTAVQLASLLVLVPATLRAELRISTSPLAPGGEQAVALFTGGPLDLDEAQAWTLGVAGPADELPSALGIESRDASGRVLDRVSVPLVSAECAADVAPGASCARSLPLFVIAAESDRAHPALRGRVLVGRVGGQLLVTSALLDAASGSTTESSAEGGPRALAQLRVVGASGERPLRARVRVQILTEPRARAKGGPNENEAHDNTAALGGTAAEALELARVELQRAGSVFGACGIELAVERLAVVDVPAPRYLMVGCRGASLASGGEIVVSSRRGTHRYRTHAGQTPREVGLGLAELLRGRGGTPEVLENPLVSSDAHPTVDLELGAEVLGVRSSDPTLGVCALVVDTGDGIDHFKDGDAGAGTLEERALVRALADDDRQTIEVIVAAHFAGRGRIGESFIHTPGGALENTVILDRSGVYAGAQSATLAHELGHVLLQLPGHTDDFGVDTPSALMDSDASDATSAGPRRLDPADCLRAVRETGPASYERLLAPLDPVKAE